MLDNVSNCLIFERTQPNGLKFKKKANKINILTQFVEEQ